MEDAEEMARPNSVKKYFIVLPDLTEKTMKRYWNTRSMLNVARGVKLVDDVYGTGLLWTSSRQSVWPYTCELETFFLFSAVFR